MSSLMPSDMLGYAASFSNGTDAVQTGHVVRHGEYPAVLAQSPIFVYNPLGDVKQADVGHHARFLAVDVYPLVFVKVGADILFREVAHIRERQPGERAETGRGHGTIPVWRFSVSLPSAGEFRLW